MTKWALDPDDISVSWRGLTIGGDPEVRLREFELTVTHRPTGLSVTKAAPRNHYSRKQGAKTRGQLEKDATAELEELVAKHLRVPGR